MSRAETQTKEGYHIPATRSVANAVFETPTRFLVMSFKPKDSNSVKTLWNLKVHTNATEIATISWAMMTSSSMISDFIIRYW